MHSNGKHANSKVSTEDPDAGVSGKKRGGYVARVKALAGKPIEHLSPHELRPHPKNPRTHSKRQIGQLARSIDAFGFLSVVVINERGEILAGHGRVEAAKVLRMEAVPCQRVTGLAATEELAFLLADNRIAGNAGTDRGKLALNLNELMIELPKLEIDGLDISITGYPTAEIDIVIGDHAEGVTDPTDDFGGLRLRSRPVTRRGDAWTMGKHRLACGDARDPAVHKRLLGGRRADMVITDPPWNVKVNGHVSGRGAVAFDEFAFASGEMSQRQFRKFLATSIRRMIEASVDGALIYVFIDWRGIELACEVGRTLGLILRNICVWSKTGAGQGSFYRSQHELVAVFQKPGADPVNNIELGRFGRSRSNVWQFAAPNRFKASDDPLRGHPTPKPVAMIAEAILDATPRGGLVLDPFLGSGTLILAAEKVGRIGFGIEYEPGYCDLAIERWQAFTGRDAILETTGETYDELRAQRDAEAASDEDGVDGDGSNAAPSDDDGSAADHADPHEDDDRQEEDRT